MINSIIILSSIILLRTFLFNYNYLFSLLNLLPMEMIALSTSNLNCNIVDCQKENYQVILDWIFLGWVDNISIQNQEVYSSWSPIISLIISLFIFNLLRICYYGKKINMIILKSGIIRFFLIHFSWIIIWSINNLLYLPKGDFWILFFNLILFCFVSSGLMAIIFYMIYGKHFIYYRFNYYWLIQFYNVKYKYYLLIDLAKRLLSSFFIFFYHYHLPLGMFYLLGLQITYISIICCINLYNVKAHKNILLFNLFYSIIPTIISLLKNLLQGYKEILDIVNFILMVIYLAINLIINGCIKSKKIINPGNSDDSIV